MRGLSYEEHRLCCRFVGERRVLCSWLPKIAFVVRMRQDRQYSMSGVELYLEMREEQCLGRRTGRTKRYTESVAVCYMPMRRVAHAIGMMAQMLRGPVDGSYSC
jgi:hypothetical protein